MTAIRCVPGFCCKCRVASLAICVWVLLRTTTLAPRRAAQ